MVSGVQMLAKQLDDRNTLRNNKADKIWPKIIREIQLGIHYIYLFLIKIVNILCVCLLN